MARLFLCVMLVLGLAACETDGREAELSSRVRELDAQLDEAREKEGRLADRLAEERERSKELYHDLIHRSDLDRARFVDLYDGGPTMRGTFLALPRLGKMRWTCDGDRFRIVFVASAATVDVDYDTPVASREEVVHPGQKLGATVGVSEPVVWTITHEHKPGFIRARIAVTPGRSDRGGCLLPHVELEETGRLYD